MLSIRTSLLLVAGILALEACLIQARSIGQQQRKRLFGGILGGPVVSNPSSGQTQFGPAVLPYGASLVQYTPCQTTSATVPLFVSQQWSGSSTITSAYITQHGANNDPDQYFDYLYPYVAAQSLLIAPGFYTTRSTPAPEGFYQPYVNMAWSPVLDQWPAGRDAFFPSSSSLAAQRSGRRVRTKLRSADFNQVQCSSFETYEALLDRLSDKSLYPNLANVYFVGHSGGANMVSRYAQLMDSSRGLNIRFVIINAANHAYFTDARPWLRYTSDSCPSAFRYPYQLVSSNMPRWVLQRFRSLTRGVSGDSNRALVIFNQWANRNIAYLVGNADVLHTGTERCTSQAQGGPARRDRNYAFWAYENLLAGSQTGSYPIDEYFGYGNLTKTGANQFNVRTQVSLNHQSCIIPNVGHDEPQMLRTNCAMAALFGQEMPSGVSPQQQSSPVGSILVNSS